MVAVFLRYIYVAFASPVMQSYFNQYSYQTLIIMGLGAYLVLLLLKVLFAAILFQFASKAKDIVWFFGEKRATDELRKDIEKLTTMQRFTVYNGRIL